MNASVVTIRVTLVIAARRIVKFQSDFQEQKNSLEELVEARGHVCLFLPKFHCELNFIEMGSRKIHPSRELYAHIEGLA